MSSIKLGVHTNDLMWNILMKSKIKKSTDADVLEGKNKCKWQMIKRLKMGCLLNG